MLLIQAFMTQTLGRRALFWQTPPPPEFSAEEARDIADSVLGGRAYAEAARPPSLQERIFDWIAEIFRDLLNALTSSGGRGIFAWVIIAVFVALIGFLVYRLFGGVGSMPLRQGSAKPTMAMIEDRTAAEWMQAAEAAEAEHDWRVGIRCRHRSLVATLVDRQVVTARPGFTAGEIQKWVGADYPAANAPLQEATGLFKDSWYGWVDATEADSDRFAELVSHVLAATAGSDANDTRQRVNA